MLEQHSYRRCHSQAAMKASGSVACIGNEVPPNLNKLVQHKQLQDSGMGYLPAVAADFRSPLEVHLAS